MFERSTLVGFSGAAYILIVVPGPAVAYVVARSLDQGRAAGLASVAGVALGAYVHAIAAAVGLSALLATSAVAFSVVKYLGAGYLIFLGITTLRRAPLPTGPITLRRQPLGQIFRQGIVVNVLNPKAALFFLAFLPQFTDPSRGSVAAQILILGLIFVVIALLSDGMYALLAGHLGDRLRSSPALARLQQRIAGGTYLVLGAAAAFIRPD